MTIAVDLNEVIRDFCVNFLKVYIDNYNHEYKCDEDFSFWTNDMKMLLPFQSLHAYNKFTYADYAFELFGKCDTVEWDTVEKFNEWITKTITNINTNEEIKVIITSSMEYGLSIPNTLFFLSKIGCKAREYYFPKDSLTIWDKCDILITANPYLINSKPEGKKVIRVETEYNTDAKNFDYSVKKATELFKNNNIIEDLCL